MMGTVLLSTLITIVIVAFAYLLLRRGIRRILSGAELIDSVRDEVNHLVVELNQTTERNIAIIEERITRLKRLTEEADRKIVLLGKESEKVKLGSEVYERLKRAAAVPTKPTATGRAPAPGTASASAPATAAAHEDGADNSDGATTAGDSGETSVHEEVIALYRQGFDTKIIAARTGITIGEVELMVSLANRNL